MDSMRLGHRMGKLCVSGGGGGGVGCWCGVFEGGGVVGG